jgi:two-component system, NarL family, response regulator
MSQPVIRVLCVDDHEIVRDGIASVLERDPRMQLVASASTGEAAVAMFREHHPDVTLMDLRLPRMSGFEAIQAIRAEDPEARIVVLTMFDGDEHIHRALRAGATTYVLKESLAADLLSTILAVHQGAKSLPPQIEAKLTERASQPALTPREIQVMQLVFEGYRNKEISATLEISVETVQAHLRHIFTKLNVSDRTAALNVALRRGIVSLK